MIYKEIAIPNLEILQQKVRMLVTQYDLDNPRLYYPKDQSAFLEIEEIQELMNLYDFSKNKIFFAFFLLKGHGVSSIHIDTGLADYSLNIPIENCDNTYTVFYDTDASPTVDLPSRVIDGVEYSSYQNFKDTSVLKKIGQYQTNVPAIVNIKRPHGVVNKNNTLRINLLIRYTDNSLMYNLYNS